MEKKEKQYLINSRNTFYSLCRNINNFDCNSDILDKYIKKLNELYEMDNHGIYYLRSLDFLKYKILNHSMNAEEASVVLIKSIDPNYDVYQIFEDYCNMYDIKNECVKKFHFFDKRFLELEKLYIKLNNLEDEYSFAKRKELK